MKKNLYIVLAITVFASTSLPVSIKGMPIPVREKKAMPENETFWQLLKRLFSQERIAQERIDEITENAHKLTK